MKFQRLNFGIFYIKNYVHLDFFIGAKERSEIYEAFENIYPILKGFKKA